jgi:RimJ/RimL family protein N-acetyltransferase
VYLEVVEIEFLETATHSKLYLRPARLQDETLVLHWKNSSYVRQFSFRDEIISSETHHAWFLNRIENFEKSPCYMACLESTDLEIGFLRLDRISSNSLEVGILIEKESAGKGFGTQSLGLLVSEARNKFKSVNLVARIASNNVASIALFERAGFVSTRNDSGKEILNYQLKL